MSDIGATSPGRWHATHLAYMIGATSPLNVGAATVAEAVCCGAPLVTVDVIPSHAIPRNTRTRVRVSNLLNLIRYTLPPSRRLRRDTLANPRQTRAVRYQAARRTRRIPSSRRPYHRRRPDRDQ